MKNPTWRKVDPDTNETILRDSQHTYIEWLVTPAHEREPKTVKALAEKLGVHDSTLYRWRQDEDFQRELDRRYGALNVNPERIQSVVDAMHRAAIGGDVQAMKLYMEYTKRFTPTTKVVTDRGLEQLSDDELAELLKDERIALFPRD